MVLAETSLMCLGCCCARAASRAACTRLAIWSRTGVCPPPGLGAHNHQPSAGRQPALSSGQLPGGALRQHPHQALPCRLVPKNEVFRGKHASKRRFFSMACAWWSWPARAAKPVEFAFLPGSAFDVRALNVCCPSSCRRARKFTPTPPTAARSSKPWRWSRRASTCRSACSATTRARKARSVKPPREDHPPADRSNLSAACSRSLAAASMRSPAAAFNSRSCSCCSPIP